MVRAISALLALLAMSPAFADLYATSAISYNAVLRYDATGAFVQRVDATVPAGMPQGIDIGPDHNVYVLDQANSQIKVYTPDGAFINVLATVSQNSENLRFGPDGNIYVGKGSENAIEKYSPTGIDLGVFASGNGLQYSRGFGWDSAGNFYVTSNGTNQVLEYTGAGAYVGVFGNTGSNPVDLAVGANGNVYVAAASSNVIDIFNGSSLSPIGTLSVAEPVGLRFGTDQLLYVSVHNPSGSPNNAILRYNGSSFDTFVAPSSGGLTYPYYFAFSSPIPEPSTLPLFGIGLAGWLAARRGKKKRHRAMSVGRGKP